MDLALFEKIKPLLELPKSPPVLGFSSIDWKKLSEKIAENWKIPSLNLSLKEKKKLSQEALLSGFSENFYLVSFHFSPIEGEVFWIMDHADIARLSSLVLSKEKEEETFYSEILQESFYHFFLMELLKEVTEHPFFHAFSPKIVFENSLPEKECLSFDVQIQTEKHSLWGRILIPFAFKESWNTYLRNHFPKEELSLEAKEHKISLSLSVGEFSLSEEEWEKVKPGDFITVEQSSYDPHLKAGIATLFLEKLPLFKAVLSEKTLEVSQFLSEEESSSFFEIHIGQVFITLEKLLHLKKAPSLEPPPLQEELTIVKEGKKVGEGSFHYLGNRLGILLHKKNKSSSL